MQEYTAFKIVSKHEKPINSSYRSIIPKKRFQVKEGTNFIGLLIASLVAGLAMSSLGNDVAQFRSLIEQFNLVIMKIVQYLIRILPLGMFFLMFQEGLKTKSVLNLIYQIGWFLLTEIICFFVYQFLFLPLLYLLIIRRNPFSFIRSIFPVFLTAFGTSSSLATLPVALRCMEDDNKISQHISRFILPLGMVVNMQGVCIDLTTITIFLAQMEGVYINVVNSIVLCLTVVMLAIASPAMPATGSPVIILTCLAVVNVQSNSNLSLILTIFWITDRLSTIGNVVGDCYIAVFVSKLCDKPVKNCNVSSITIERNIPSRCEDDTENVKL